ncbi:MAG: hypothetical protein IJN07_06325 [Clostridia bacterium]|nr:hypothetical protein [Clostridia bacterium]
MTIRMIDYYVKGLPFDARQEIFNSLEIVNVLAVEKMLEKESGYPRFRSVGYSDEDIASHLRKKSRHFERVNELMVKNGRPPLFADPSDTYACSLRYVEVMRRYRERESDSSYPSLTDFGKKPEMVDVLIEKMGCTWNDYIPESHPDSL